MNNPTELTEAEETRRGQLLVEMLGLEEDKYPAMGSKRRTVSYDPPRYSTQWGRKTALGLFRSVRRLVLDGE